MVYPEESTYRTMRSSIRPFITAYKNRLSKSRAPRPLDIDDSEKAISKPLPLDSSVNAPAMSRLDAEYSAAMEAADAVFGGKAIEVVAVQESSQVRARRILPCLLQPETQIVPQAEEVKKTRRTPRAVKPPERNAADTFSANALNPPVKQAIAENAVESSVVVMPDIHIAPVTRRERSSIQSRWVLKSELKPGEKWKRRLCEAAR